MLANRDLAAAEIFSHPPNNATDDALVVQNVRLVSWWDDRVRDLMRHHAKQIACHGGRVEVNDALSVMAHPVQLLLVGRALDFHRPPLAVQFEEQRRAAFARLWRGCGGLWHLI